MSENMLFCIGEGSHESKGSGFQKHNQIFNTDVSEDEFNKVKKSLNIKNFKLPVAKWIDKKDIENPTKEQSQMGGYLKKISYEDAWKELWATFSSDDKAFFRNLPHFNAKIFKDITGIEIADASLSGKKVRVELDGKSYTATID